MKEPVPQNNTKTQSAPASHAAMHKTQAAGVPAGELAQLFALANGSSQVQAQLKLTEELRGSQKVQSQSSLAALINQGEPAQMRSVVVNRNAGLEHEADVMGGKALPSGDTGTQQPLAQSSDGTGFEAGPPSRDTTQLRQDVVQCIGFLPGQAEKMIAWLLEHEIAFEPVFQGIMDRYIQADDLADDDAEAITLLFLTKETPYREFDQADLALDFIFADVGGLSLPRNVTTVGEFTNAYKTFFHLYRRAVNGGSHNPILDVHNGFLGLDAALGGMQVGAATFDTDETASGSDVHIAMIRNFAQHSQLDFHSQESGIFHLVKHGTLFNHGAKITGHEDPGYLQALYNAYINRANHIVATGTVTEQMGRTLGKKVFFFILGGEKAIVTFDDATASAELATYFPTEPQDVINDKPIMAHHGGF
jgi:hypothetical protein